MVWYWAGPGSHNDLNDVTAAQLSAGGWNMGWAEKPEHLDIYHRHGIRAMVSVGLPSLDDPEQLKALDAKIAWAKGHPGTYAYYLCDEPNAAAFKHIAKVVSYLRKKDPGHAAIVNLYPTYANSDQLGTTTYEEHLQRFAATVKPNLFSYDHYPFAGVGSSQYFWNLALVREASLQAGVPFNNIFQASEFYLENWATPTEGQIRWQTYTSLAYGAQGICHFVYNCRNCKKSAFFKDRPESEQPLPIYWATSRINKDFVAIAKELQPLKSLAVYHTGPLPAGGVAMPAGSPFALTSQSARGCLLGCFGKTGKRISHILVVNLDYDNAISATLDCPGAVDVFAAAKSEWTSNDTGSRVVLNLIPGSGALLRLK